MYKCDVEYTYEVDGKLYSFDKVFDKPRKYIENDTINVHYHKDNPEDHRINYASLYYVGVTLSVGGCVCLILSSLVMYFISKNRGAGTAFMATNVVSRIT